MITPNLGARQVLQTLVATGVVTPPPPQVNRGVLLILQYRWDNGLQEWVPRTA